MCHIEQSCLEWFTSTLRCLAEVVCDHIDWLLQEDDPILRRKASKLLKRVVSTASSAAWDLISWSLQDIDTQVRINAANTLPSMVNREAKMAIIFAERALLDTDSKVRNKALQVLQRVDVNVGRAKQIIIASTSIQTRKYVAIVSKCLTEY